MEAVSAVRRAVEAGDLVPDGGTVLVAVSGGVDSMVALDVLQRLAPSQRWTVVVAHFDHRLRGAASRADARFVAAEAKRRGIPARMGSWKEARARGKGGIAARARAARYAFLREEAARLARSGAEVRVVTAHTASDQAETLLLRLLRGTGARGLAGIPPRRKLGEAWVVRPLLGLTREEVREHAQRFGVAWREDASNASPKRARSRVRHDVLPMLAGMQPEVVRVLARAATQAAESARIVDRVVRRALERVRVRAGAGWVHLDRARVRALPLELRPLVLRAALAEVRGDAGVGTAHVEALSSILRRKGSRAVLAHATAECTADELRIEAAHVPGTRDPRAPRAGRRGARKSEVGGPFDKR